LREWLPHAVTDFRGRPLPEAGWPTGYAALIERYDLPVPPPPRLAAIALRHHPTSTDAWRMLTPRHRPEDSLQGHLTFALKWEGVDLSVLAALFRAIDPAAMAAIVRTTPTGAFVRRLWFLYEWITEKTLDLPDPGKVRRVEVVDPVVQVALRHGTPSPRQKVIDNLPGTRLFCPMVRRTTMLDAHLSKRLDARARAVIGQTSPDLVARAAAFLLLNDSKSSFAIEGERPSGARAARWGQAIAQAGSRPLSVAEFERLQRIVIGDARFVRLGLREEGGFVGTHDRATHEPVPEHISARAEDLRSLLDGIVAYDARAARGGIDPVVAAAVLAFGFVYIHPFLDGNGRIHRWLIHHVLAAAAYNPRGLVFPISAAILRQLTEYRELLESYSAPLLPFIEWQPTLNHNVAVLNDTADYYRYFDATAHAEFLYGCVEQTVEHDLPDEVRFLKAYDCFSSAVQQIVDMPDRQIELLRALLAQGNGCFSQRARSREFATLTDEEALRIEALYAATFAKVQRQDR
jgi:hypothetical protein